MVLMQRRQKSPCSSSVVCGGGRERRGVALETKDASMTTEEEEPVNGLRNDAIPKPAAATLPAGVCAYIKGGRRGVCQNQ